MASTVTINEDWQNAIIAFCVIDLLALLLIIPALFLGQEGRFSFITAFFAFIGGIILVAISGAAPVDTVEKEIRLAGYIVGGISILIPFIFYSYAEEEVEFQFFRRNRVKSTKNNKTSKRKVFANGVVQEAKELVKYVGKGAAVAKAEAREVGSAWGKNGTGGTVREFDEAGR